MEAKKCLTGSLFSTILSVLCFWIVLSEGASVDLSVREGVSLVGESCPGIVTLECEAVNLDFLRWRFNGDGVIFIYSSDNQPSQDVPPQAAFPSVQLVDISQSTADPNLANYTSLLTANLSLIQTEGVMEIECGDSITFELLPVNVKIIERTPPRNPGIVMVTAEYQYEKLDRVTIEWRKSGNYCPSYGLNFTYQVNITSERSTLVEHNDTVDLCVTKFQNIDRGTEDIQISILASNELGTSELVLYPFVIGRSQYNYYNPSVSLADDVIIAECVSSNVSVIGSVCNVSYTTDPMYTGLSDPLTTMLDTPLEIPGLNVDVTYYFEFSLVVNNSLRIVERTNFTSPTTTAGLTGGQIAGIVIAVTVVLLIIVVVVVILIKRFKKQRTYSPSRTGSSGGVKPEHVKMLQSNRRYPLLEAMDLLFSQSSERVDQQRNMPDQTEVRVYSNNLRVQPEECVEPDRRSIEDNNEFAQTPI